MHLTWRWEASENLTLARRTHELKVVRARKKKLEKVARRLGDKIQDDRAREEERRATEETGAGAGTGLGAKGAYTPTGLGVASHWTSNARSSPHIQSAASHWISNASSSLHSQSVGTATTTGVTRATEEEEGQEANGIFIFSKP